MSNLNKIESNPEILSLGNRHKALPCSIREGYDNREITVQGNGAYAVILKLQDKADKSKPILIVEDSVPDYLTVVRVFRKLGYENPVYHCESGQEALDFLYRKGDYENDTEAPRPGIILLDLNMPGTDGREVLKQIKSDEKLKAIPVVIFTTSDSDRDIEDCYKNGANSYITKPVDLEKLLSVMDVFKNYWFKAAALPSPA